MRVPIKQSWRNILIVIPSKDYQNFPEKNEGLTIIKLFLQDGKLSFSKLQGTNKLVMTTQYENAECKE